MVCTREKFLWAGIDLAGLQLFSCIRPTYRKVILLQHFVLPAKIIGLSINYIIRSVYTSNTGFSSVVVCLH